MGLFCSRHGKPEQQYGCYACAYARVKELEAALRDIIALIEKSEARFWEATLEGIDELAEEGLKQEKDNE